MWIKKTQIYQKNGIIYITYRTLGLYYNLNEKNMAEQILTMPQTKAPLTTPPMRPSPMEPPKPPAPLPPATSKENSGKGLLIVIAVIAFLVGAAAAGITVYLMQDGSQADLQNQMQQNQQQYEQSLTELQDNLAQAKKTISDQEEELQKMESSYIPNIKIQTNEDLTEAVIFDGNTQIQKITFENGGLIELFKQTSENVYFVTKPIGIGGYILYWPLAGDMYKYNLITKNFSKIFGDEEKGVIEDLSTDEKWLVYKNIESHKIILYNIETKEKKEFAVEEKYTQFGDIKISPNAQKLAYAAAFGSGANNELEESAVFIVDCANNTTQKIKEDTGKIYHVKGWTTNEDKDLQYYFFE